MPTILIAPDALKSTATAKEAATWLSEGVREILPEADIHCIALADGGEGTAETFPGQRITLPTTDANGNLTEATYTYNPETHTAYIDIAAASGLPQVEHNPQPLKADTYGTGVLIADAQTRGATHIVLGLGGSATTDGGTGILVALGASPLDATGLPLRQGGADLIRLASIDTAQLNIPAAALHYTLLADVTVPATGPEGAAQEFGPQKGASTEDVTLLEAGITQLCAITDIDPTTPGFGAAGATPVGLTWLSRLLHGDDSHITLEPGARTIAQATGAADLAQRADLIITAEGGCNQQSLRGKVVGTLKELANPDAMFVVAAGSFEFPDGTPSGMHAVELIDADTATQLRDAGRKAAERYLRLNS